jgi:hypothetical protein
MSCVSCKEGSSLEGIEHSENAMDWNLPTSYQGYQVYKCRNCGEYWGCTIRYTFGTGYENNWESFGDESENVSKGIFHKKVLEILGKRIDEYRELLVCYEKSFKNKDYNKCIEVKKQMEEMLEEYKEEREMLGEYL